MTTPTLPADFSGDPASARFGKFVRTQMLGAGGMGEVWKSWDTQLGRWVALKFLKGGANDEISRFIREARTAGRLNHPNIAAIHEVGSDQGRHYIAMQYVEGETLTRHPRNDRRDLVRLVRDAALAVHHANAQGIVHRDLKPDNIMVSKGHVYVMDFGLARQTEGASQVSLSGMIVGTPNYMSPEQSRGQIIDARTDVWSLGASLYELLTDRKPFSGATIFETLIAVQEKDVAPPGIGDRDLETILLKCLEKDRDRRYESAKDLADDLDRWLTGDPIAARPASAVYRVRKRLRKHRAMTAMAGALLIVAVTAAVAVIRTDRSGTEKRRTQAEADELCRQALEKINKVRELWRTKIARREDWERLWREADLCIEAAIAKEGKLAGIHHTLGLVRENQGRWKDAIAAFDRALELNPDHLEARRSRGMAWLELSEEVFLEVAMSGTITRITRRKIADGHLERARADLERVRSRSPGGVPALYLAAMIALTEQRNDDVLRESLEILKIDPTHEKAWLAKARAEAAAGRVDEAKRTLDELLDGIMPKLARGYNLRAKMHAAGQDWKLTEADTTRAIELDPRYVTAYSIRGIARQRMNRWEDAAADMTRMIELEPANTNGYGNRAVCRMRLGDSAGALADFDRIVQIDGQTAAAYGLRGSIRKELQDWDGAIADSTKALDLDPDHLQGLEARGFALMKLNRMQQAFVDYDRLSRIAPHLPEGWLNRALIRFTLGDSRGAREDATRAIDLNPGIAEGYSLRARASADLKMWKEAIEDATRAIGLDSSCGAAYETRGLTLASTGEFEAAVEDFNRAVEFKPSNPSVYLNRGAARYRTGDLQGALQDCTKSIDLDPGNFEAYVNRSQIRYKLGDIEGSVSDTEKALALAPADWPMREALKKNLRSMRKN